MVREYEYTWKIVAHEPPSRMTVESTRNRKERLKRPQKNKMDACGLLGYCLVPVTEEEEWRARPYSLATYPATK